MVTILKATVADNVFETFYDLVDNGITDPNPPATGTRKWIWSSFPDGVIDKESGVVGTVKGVSYPLIVIEAPTANWETLTITKNWVNLSITIMVYSTRREQAIQMSDEITDLLETSRMTDLFPLKLVFFNLANQETDVEFRDEIKLHKRTSTFTMRFSFTRTY